MTGKGLWTFAWRLTKGPKPASGKPRRLRGRNPAKLITRALYYTKHNMWKVYTDGSASPNPGPGGAGSVILHDKKVIAELTHAGGETTNNKMELYAVIMTFPNLPKDEPVTLYTDSQYVQKGLTEWLSGWIKRGWKTAGKKPVKNQELWQQLVVLRKEYPKVKVVWIKAHQDQLPMAERVDGWEWNVRADELANIGTTRSKKDI